MTRLRAKAIYPILVPPLIAPPNYVAHTEIQTQAQNLSIKSLIQHI
jgi:hypothetical protein